MFVFYLSIIYQMIQIFSFGVILYEMFEGQPPWNELSNLEAYEKICKGELMEISKCKLFIKEIISQCW